MSKLKHKRRQVFIGILTIVVGNSIVTAAPSLDTEIAKILFLTFANIVMLIMVWDAYFDEQLSQKGVWGVLKDSLSITAVGTVTTLIVSKIITRIIGDLIIAWGTLGWLIAGTIAGMATAILGIAWAFYCDDLYRNSTS